MLLRYLFTGRLRLLTPLHIGSGKPTELTDSPLRTGVDGLPIIPGTALGGLLRTQAERFAPFLATDGNWKCRGIESDKECSCLVCRLFGAVSPTAETDRTSRLVIRDARLSQANNLPAVAIRDGIGISRQRGTVAQNLKFDLAILPAGTSFNFEAQLQSDEPAQVQLFAVALTEMAAGRVRLGGRSGRGTGRCVLDLENVRLNGFEAGSDGLAKLKRYLKTPPAQRVTLDLGDSLTGAAFLENQRPPIVELPRDAADGKSEVPPNFIEVQIRLAFTKGLLLSNPVQALLEGSDSAFVQTAHYADGSPTLYLPGSSLRGMLRAQAEKVARTLSYSFAANNYNTYAHKLAACDPLVDDEKAIQYADDRVYPYAGVSCSHYLKKNIESFKRSHKPNQQRLAEWIEENSCLACRLFGHTYRAGRLKISDAFPTSGSLNPVGDTRQRLDFVAINRFTGGARDTAKFDALAHFSRAADSQKLNFDFTLTLADINPQTDKWMLGWLAFVLRDLFIGELRLGSGKTKGLGQVEGHLIELTVGALAGDTALLVGQDETASVVTTPSGVSGLFQLYKFSPDQTDQTAERNLLKNYAQAFYKEIQDFERNKAQSVS